MTRLLKKIFFYFLFLFCSSSWHRSRSRQNEGMSATLVILTKSVVMSCVVSRLIDMHTSLASAVLECIKKRRLDLFFELEEKIMSGTTLDK